MEFIQQTGLRRPQTKNLVQSCPVGSAPRDMVKEMQILSRRILLQQRSQMILTGYHPRNVSSQSKTKNIKTIKKTPKCKPVKTKVQILELTGTA